MKRRDFMTLSGLVTGSCLFEPRFARLVRDICINEARPFMAAPTGSRTMLHAVGQLGRFHLHLGDPNEEPEHPTWGDYLEDQGVEVGNRADVNEWVLDQYGYSLEESGLVIEADAPIDRDTYENWLDGEYILHRSPMARAYHYLEGLPLANERMEHDTDPLAELTFWQGPHPGSNLTYVQADDFATLACLQERLNQLGESVHVKIVEES